MLIVLSFVLTYICIIIAETHEERRIGRSGDSRLTPNQNLLMPMADGQLESILSQLHYAKRTLSPVRLVLKVTLFCSCIVQGCFFVFGGVLTRLDYTSFVVDYSSPAVLWMCALSEIDSKLGNQRTQGKFATQ